MTKVLITETTGFTGSRLALLFAYSYEHSKEIIENNLIGAINLMEACLREVSHFKHFIFADTTEEYGMTKQIPTTEESECAPNSPYVASKFACTKYLMYMWKAYEFSVTTMRVTNIYRRKNDTHFFIEKAIYQMLTKKAIGEIFNFSTKDPKKIEGVAELVKELTEWKGETIWHFISRRVLDVIDHRISSKKARRILKWKTLVKLVGGLKRATGR